MKNFILFFVLIATVAAASAQRLSPITVTASESDTSKGAETDYIVIPNASHFDGVYDLVIQSLCTQIGGTSEGTITLEKSLDGTSYKPMLTTIDTDFITVNDTFTVTNGAILQYRIKTYWPYYRIKIVGGSGDTTLFTTKYGFAK